VSIFCHVNNPRAGFGFVSIRLAAALLVISSATIGCSEDCDFDDVDVQGRAHNPEGLSYPTDRLGAAPRDGHVPGDRIPNFTFRGFVDSNREAGLQTVSFADYYDPNEQRSARVLHLMVVAMWCPYCRAETESMVPHVPTLRSEGASFVQVIIDGPEQQEAPDLCNVADWIDSMNTNFTILFDINARRLSSVIELNSIPFNALIDLRSMEVLAADVGVPIDFPAYVREALSWVASNPPS